VRSPSSSTPWQVRATSSAQRARCEESVGSRDSQTASQSSARTTVGSDGRIHDGEHPRTIAVRTSTCAHRRARSSSSSPRAAGSSSGMYVAGSVNSPSVSAHSSTCCSSERASGSPRALSARQNSTHLTYAVIMCVTWSVAQYSV
jgi:hypothetical protein